MCFESIYLIKATPPRAEWLTRPPPISASNARLTCFTDASWNSTSHKAGGGWYCIDHENVIILQGARVFEIISSPLMAEAIAIRSALLHALEAGITEICIKSDYQALIAAIFSKRFPADLYRISRDIETLSLCFVCISFCFIPRNLNSRADSMAKFVLNSSPTN
ncbi:hypothetical protein Bca101_033618 [Brassica carinata]